ncbi:MAG: hypothetical protein HY824_15490 [Acidobacteria bacterium]|nr:hypothetical protein [Acidobacteriota bacterium]
MTKTRATAFTAAVGLLILSGPLLAHHANAIFDVGKRVTVTGTVTEWFWANPHCLLRFDAKDDKGQMVHWVAETQAPPNMIPFGWSKLSFKAGDVVTLTLEPVKSGQALGRILQAVLPDGTTLVAGATAVPAGTAGGPPPTR